MSFARYDGYAEWYDETFAGYGDLESATSSAALLVRLLGPGEGRCLDVACGTGLHAEAIRSTGRRVVGIDVSRDQLRLARTRVPAVARADAARLPFADASFAAAVCTYLHTDTDAIAQAFTEIARILQPRGRFVFLGVHPCFRGHFVEHTADLRVIHPGYWETGWHTESPYRTHRSIRERVGAHHVPLADLVNALLSCGLRLTSIDEGDRSQPFADQIALVAVRD